MGMNYYTKTNTCATCGHKPEGIHLGKSSYGWQFSFQYNGGEYYKNVEEMREWLKDKKIENEEGSEVSHEEFWAMVKEKQENPANKNHALEMIKSNQSSYHDTIIDGYSFTDVNFS